MPENITRFTKEQISDYAELHNLVPINTEAMVINMMRLEEMIQELQNELSLTK